MNYFLLFKSVRESRHFSRRAALCFFCCYLLLTCVLWPVDDVDDEWNWKWRKNIYIQDRWNMYDLWNWLGIKLIFELLIWSTLFAHFTSRGREKKRAKVRSSNSSEIASELIVKTRCSTNLLANAQIDTTRVYFDRSRVKRAKLVCAAEWNENSTRAKQRMKQKCENSVRTKNWTEERKKERKRISKKSVQSVLVTK